jgi:voltage-gated potassium channel
MVSEAIRPAAVDYLDRMLRDRDAGMRVESARIEAGSALDGQTVQTLLGHRTGLQLLALHRADDRWEDAPPESAFLRVNDQLVYTGGPEVRKAVERLVRGG